MRRSTRDLFVIGALLAAGCHGGASRYDAEAGRAYRAAWEKRRAGDEAGYKSGLTTLAQRRGTWAGDRAALDLELYDEAGGGGSVWKRLLEEAAQLAGDPKLLGGGVRTLGAPAAVRVEPPASPPQDPPPAP